MFLTKRYPHKVEEFKGRVRELRMTYHVFKATKKEVYALLAGWKLPAKQEKYLKGYIAGLRRV